MDINLRQSTCKINLRQLPCTKSASNDIYFNLRQMPCTKSASNAMQKLKCVKSSCVNCHAKTNMRQMPLRQSSSALKITHSASASNAIQGQKSGGQNSCVKVLCVEYLLRQKSSTPENTITPIQILFQQPQKLINVRLKNCYTCNSIQMIYHKINPLHPFL